jgi:hypothetical protein
VVDEKRSTTREDTMDMSQVTVKEILEKRLGDEKATMILEDINDAHQKGKSGEEFREYVRDAVKKEGLDPGEIKFVVSHVLPTV